MNEDEARLRVRIEELRAEQLTLVKCVHVEASREEAWELLGDPLRLPEMIEVIDSVELTTDGYRIDYGYSAVQTATYEQLVPGVGEVTNNRESISGLGVPSPKLAAGWILLEDGASGLQVEFGAAWRFKSRLGALAGQVAIAQAEKVIEEWARSAKRLLELGSSQKGEPRTQSDTQAKATAPRASSDADTHDAVSAVDAASVTSSEGDIKLSAEDAKRLQRPKLTGRKVAYFAASAAGMSQKNQDAAEMAKKGLDKGAQKALLKHQSALESAQDWPELVHRLSMTVDAHRASLDTDNLSEGLVNASRMIGLTSHTDLASALAISAFGYAAGAVEAETYKTSPPRSVKKVAKATRRTGDTAHREAVASVAIVAGRPVGNATASIIEIDGFAPVARNALAQTAGAALDRSPDAEARSPQVVDATPALFLVGLTMHTVRRCM